MSFISDIIDGYNDLMINRRDRRVDNWFLMSSPWPTLIIVACYIYFVKRLGPSLMKNRQPFDLRKTIIFYNIIQVVGSFYLVYQIMVYAWIPRYSLRCQPVDYSDDPVEVWVAHISWWYYFCKFTEFLDTIFFVLRKKFDQITNLHVIHHALMPAAVWWGVKFTAGGHATFFGTLNTFVHVIMYTYYLLAALGPEYQKYLWWKKHLTTLQMVQFMLIFLHSAQVLFNGCNFPKIMASALCVFAATFLVLFSNFYIQAYIKRRRLPKVELDKMNGKAVNKTSNGIHPLERLTKACYIGQNGLTNGNENGYSNGKTHSHHENGHSNGAARNQKSNKDL